MFWDPPRSRQLEEEASALAEQMGDRATAAIAMALAAYSAILDEDAEEAIPVLEQSLALVEALGDTRGVAWVLIILAGALLTNHERREEGRQKIERALAMAATDGDNGDQAVPSFGHFLLGCIGAGGMYRRELWSTSVEHSRCYGTCRWCPISLRSCSR